MSLIVPWTYPGGPPCCCDACPADDLGPDPIYSPGTFDNIGEDDYAALLAGGSLSMDLSFDLSGSDTAFTGEDTWSGSFTNEPLNYRTEVQTDAPCYQQATQANTLFYTVTTRAATGFPTITHSVELPSINFTYALATIDSQRKLSLANAKSPSGAGGNVRIVELVNAIGGFDMPNALHLTVSNPLEPIPQFWEVESRPIASLQFVLPNSVYVPSQFKLLVLFDEFAVSPAYDGSISMAVTFTPSAP